MEAVKQSQQPIGWNVIYTYPNSEKKIHSELIRLNIEAYLPTQKVVRQWHDRKKKIEVPLFPNYLFIKTQRESMWRVMSVNGVVRFLIQDGQPAFVSENEIGLIKKLVDKYGDYIEVSTDLHIAAGEKVIIKHGPLAGIEGTLSSQRGSKVFIIELTAINKKIIVNVPAHSIERVE